MYIYRQKIKENSIYFNYFLNELFKLDIEKTICETSNTFEQFKKKWAIIIESLKISSYLIQPIKLS